MTVTAEKRCRLNYRGWPLVKERNRALRFPAQHALITGPPRGDFSDLPDPHSGSEWLLFVAERTVAECWYGDLPRGK